jgi:hypothetical protein
MRNPLDSATQPARIPLALKLAYSVFLAWHLWVNLGFYGPMNYLWFCDIAVLTTAVSLWTENGLLLSMTAISFLGPSALWVMDIFSHLMVSHDWWGVTQYLGDPQLPLALRCASLFHIWLPFVLFFGLHRLGYDRRALWLQTVVAIVVLILSRTIGGPPPAHSLHDVVNINCAYGTSDQMPQTKLPSWLYLCKVIVKCWVGMYLPLHFLLRWTFTRQTRRGVVWERKPVSVGATEAGA